MTKIKYTNLFENTFYRVLQNETTGIYNLYSRYTWTDKWQLMKRYKSEFALLKYMEMIKP